jgi:hypothetical protein
LALAKKATKEFNILDKDLFLMEESAKKLVEAGNQAGDKGMKDFVTLIRLTHESNREMMTTAVIIDKTTHHKLLSLYGTEEDIRKLLNKMRMEQNFSPDELANNLQRALDLFLYYIDLRIRFDPAGGQGFTNAMSYIQKHRAIMTAINEIMNSKNFERQFAVSHAEQELLHQMKSKLDNLLRVQFDNLIRSVFSLGKLFVEFNRRLTEIYGMTDQLDMVKGINLDIKRGFFSNLLGKKEEVKPLSLGLTEKDRAKIKALQGLVTNLHSTTVPAIRGRQKDVVRELQNLKGLEVDVLLSLRRMKIETKEQGRAMLKAA